MSDIEDLHVLRVPLAVERPAAQYPIAFKRLERPTAQRAGRISGTVGEYRWRYSFDVSAPDGVYAHVRTWEWRFIVREPQGRVVYRAGASSQPLLAELNTLPYFKERARLQTQVFLEEYLGLQLDAGSSSHHRRPPLLEAEDEDEE